MTFAIVLWLTSRAPMLAPINLNYACKWSNNSQGEDYSENSTLMTQVPQFSSVPLSYRLKAYEDDVGVISIHMQSTLYRGGPSFKYLEAHCVPDTLKQRIFETQII